MSPRVANAEKRYRISLLLDAYGELLTDKQRDFLRRYYEEDFSFGEIAREYKVSRQAIFDSVKHGEAALENYERVLGLIEAREGGRGPMRQGPLSQAGNRAEVIADRFRRWLGAAEAGRPTTMALNELESLAEDLDSLAADLKQAAGGAMETGEADGGTMVGAGGERRGGSGGNGSLLVGDGPEVD